MRGTLSPKPLPALLGLAVDTSDFKAAILPLLGESADSSASFLNFACDGLPAFASCTLACSTILLAAHAVEC